MTDSRDYVVVTFGSAAEDWCDLSHCPMHAHGPYTQAEAQEIAALMPAWMRPHILTLAADPDACFRAEG